MEKMLSEAAALPASFPGKSRPCVLLLGDHVRPQQYTEHVCSSEERMNPAPLAEALMEGPPELAVGPARCRACECVGAARESVCEC